MTLEELRKELSAVFYDNQDCAEAATEVTDCDEVKRAGRSFLDARENLYRVLAKNDIDIT